MSNDNGKPIEQVRNAMIGETLHSRASGVPTSSTPLSTHAPSDPRSESHPMATIQQVSYTDETQEKIDFLLPPQQPDELGRFSGYRILRKLGQGGMGMVLEAEDLKLHRRVAMKVIRPDLASDPKNCARFLREAQAAAMLDCDYICPIYYVGEENSVLFITMALLKGEALDRLLRRQSKPNSSMAIQWGIQIAKGLDVAHRSGLIHRDIKPANIWLEAREDGTSRVKILDFGLAWSAENDGQLTRSGVILGTPAYMAPEQARGVDVDHRSDLFSLGVILYEIATGQRPFQGDDAFSILTSLAVDEPTAPIRIDPNIDQGLSGLIMSLLSKTPEQRPSKASDVVRQLEQIWTATSKTSLSRANEEPITSQLNTIVAPAFVASAEEVPKSQLLPKSHPGSNFRGMGYVALALFGFLGLGWLGYTLIFRSPNGTLVIEVEEDADVRMKEGLVAIHDEEGKLLYTLSPTKNKDSSLPAGKYIVNVQGAEGVVLETERFEMKRGEVIKLRVTAAPPEPQPTTSMAKSNLESPLLATDLFEGELISQDFLNNPLLSVLPKFEGPNGNGWQKDGCFVIEKADCKVGEAGFFAIGRPSKMGAVNFRFQLEEGHLFFNFSSRNNGKSSRWLSFLCYPDGQWNIHKRRKDLINGTWTPMAPVLIAENKKPDSALASGNWIFISCRWSESEFQLWINGKKVADCADPTIYAELVAGNTQPIQIGVAAIRPGTVRMRLNYFAFWDQKNLELPIKHSKALASELNE